MVPDVPSRTAARHPAGPPHAGLHLLLLCRQRGAAPLETGAADGDRLHDEGGPGDRRGGGQTQQCDHRFGHRTTAQLLHPLLRPAVHHPQKGEQGYAGLLRIAAERLFQIGPPLETRHADSRVLRRAAASVRQLFRRSDQKGDGRVRADVAYALGYQYPQYFSRAFKRIVGRSPNEYRSSN